MGSHELDTTEQLDHHNHQSPIGASQVALVVKNLLINAEDIRDMDLIPGSG